MAAAARNRNFKNYTNSQEDEDAYDYVKFREDIKPTSFVGATAHIVKSALGGGILVGPVSYMKGGLAVAIPVNILGGIYVGYCLYLLVASTQKLMKRCRTPFLSYADAGEAAFMIFPKPNIARFAKPFRYFIDFIICVDLFGACCTYQIIVARSLKQLIEQRQEISFDGLPGYPNLLFYLLVMLPVFIAMCLITQLKYLVPFTLAGNCIVVLSIFLIVYYCFQYNPNFDNLQSVTNFGGALQFIGMSVFAMSSAGVVIPVENNMRNPKNFSKVLIAGQTLIIFCTFTISFFGYVAFTDKSQAPFTLNFPMAMLPQIFKVAICVMVTITHALNFWVPFNLCWYYIKGHIKEGHVMLWEKIFRTIFVIGIGGIAIVFPSIVGLMGFLGCFCITNMAIIWPNIITVLVAYERPGLGKYHWRLWRAIIFSLIGIFIMICGSIVSMKSLAEVFTKKDEII